MESCFKIINREYFELNKNYIKMVKQLKNVLDNKNNKEKMTIIEKIRLIRKMIKELTFKIEDFNKSPTLIDELHLLELEQEQKMINIIKQINFMT